jgi:trk system potassium uptake protein TrkA
MIFNHRDRVMAMPVTDLAFGLQVIAIKEVISDKITFIPKADFVIKDSDILVIIGEEKRLSKLNPL